MNKKGLYIIIVLIILIAFLTRLSFLDLRPLHHDEGVNYFFTKNIIIKQGYSYDPLNYHGPLYFFILALSFFILGISEFSLRLPAALFGILIVLCVLFFKYEKRWNYRIAAATSLILSPSLMFYSRYSIHESGFVLFSMICIFLLTLMIEKKNLNHFPYFGIFMALMFSMKETAIIMCFALFLICIFNLKRIREIKFNEYKKDIFLGVILFCFIYAYLFSNLFSDLNGLTNSFKGFMPWIERGISEKGHDKPFYYYLGLLLKYELPIVLFGIAGLFYSFKKNNIFNRSIAIWFLSIFIVYSFINYKTPWLIINMTVPLAFLASYGLIELYKINKIKKAITAALIAGIIYLFYFSYYVNFDKPWQKENDFAYVHSDIDILNLRDDAINGDRILIISDTYWPLPFYFDGKRVDYLEKDNTEELDSYIDDYDVFIIEDENFDEESVPQGYNYNPYTLREGVKLWVIKNSRSGIYSESS